jgi:FkbM family methyltransferase
MLRLLNELSHKNRISNGLLSPFFMLKKLLGISRPLIDKQFMIDNFNTYYEYAFEHVKGGQIIVSVPDFLGNFGMDARSDILKWFLKYGQYEPDVVAMVKQYLNPLFDVIDVGANVGLFTVLFAKMTSGQQKVLSIEPTPRALELMSQNISMNECKDKVIIFNGVATSNSGTFSINLIDGKEEYSSLGNIVHSSTNGFIVHTMEVPGETLDNLVKQHLLHPGFIKVDAEGAEYLVFKGAEETLRQYKPVLLFELSDKLLASCGSNSMMVVKLLETLGYKLIDNNHPANPIQYPFDGHILAIHRDV